jgi:hypothetical protein
MTANETSAMNHDEIARLAYLNWERDGRPHGHDQKYWLESEQQINATGHLLISELRPPPNQSPVGAKSEPIGKPKTPRRPQQRQFISRS